MNPSLPSPVVDDRAAWEAHARHLSLRNGRVLALLLCAGGLPWLLVDFLFFRSLFWINAGWRGTLAMVGVIGFFVAPRVAWMRRNPNAVFVTLGVILLASTEFFCARLVDLRWPAFVYSFFANLCLAFFPLGLRRRLAAAGLYAVVAVVGFFGEHPELIREVMFWPSLCMMVGAQGISVLLGVFIERLERENFFQARDLAAANAGLEERVGDKTRELQQLAAHVQSLREEDQARVARELHDELGQVLSALRFAVGLARRRYQRTPLEIARHFDELEALLDRTERGTRDVITSLRPRVLDEMGLVAAARWQVERTRARTGIELAFDGELSDDELSPPARVAAFRILQESLTNVERHAAAQRVAVSLRIDGGLLKLDVRDDGVGFEPKPGGRGYGIAGMRERCVSLGGRFSIDARPGAGARITAVIPATAAAMEPRA